MGQDSGAGWCVGEQRLSLLKWMMSAWATVTQLTSSQGSLSFAVMSKERQRVQSVSSCCCVSRYGNRCDGGGTTESLWVT